MFKPFQWFQAVLFGVFLVQPVVAQVALFDGNQLQQTCGQGNCANAVRTTVNRIQKLGLSEPEFNSQLGAIAAVLFEVSRGAGEKTTQQVALALQLLAQFSSDINQQDSLIWVSQQIINGGADLFDLNDPFAVSPS
ncbi:MAG: hypothetical protein COB40_04095 [Marinosulfonomonas sp.]|nr:MAG: hypothetical protein COB40_04095 [Marinosulfonomonas sp.]